MDFSLNNLSTIMDQPSMDSFPNISHIPNLISVSNIPLGSKKWIFAVIYVFGLLVATRLTSQAAFNSVRSSDINSKLPPTVPHWIPFLGSLVPLAWSPPYFVESLMRRFGYASPFLIIAGPLRIALITRVDHVNMIVKKGKHLNSHPGILWALEHLFGTPRSVLPFYRADHSGIATRPRKGSMIEPHNRINYWQAHLSQKYLSGSIMERVAERYLSTFRINLNKANIQDDWTHIPDLYSFVQSYVGRTAFETFMGSNILEVYPTLVEDFWEYDQNAIYFLRGLPRWMMPKAYRCRDRLLLNIKKWQSRGREAFDCSRTGEDDPDWVPSWGSKLMRAREFTYSKMDAMTEDSKASETLGLMFALNTNAIPALFWTLLESLRDENLGRRMVSEVRETKYFADGSDLKGLLSQPLLQSCYAEVLRLRVAIGSLREHETEDFDLGDYRVPKKTPMMMYSRFAAMNRDAWAPRPTTLQKPLEQFWPERFLEHDDNQSTERPSKPRFSMDGLNGCWLPYGAGNHMCPGRHFAKYEIIGTFATLMSNYELQLEDPSQAAFIEPDFRWALMGTLPPAGKVPFRIRRRQQGT